MRDYLAIFRRNLITPVVIAIYLLAISLLIVHQYRDAWFVSLVITINITIGIIQEIRAKRVLKKLELMSAPKARVVQTDGSVKTVDYTEVVVGDVIALQAGDELPADAEIVSAKGLEINESMLTGESAAVEKSPGDIALAATVVVAGSATARVTAIGPETTAGQMNKALKRYAPQLTPLQRILQRAISWLTYGAVAVAAVIFVVYFLTGQDAVTILRTITAAAVTVVPEGLLLASSLLLAFGSLHLAQAKVLPQKLSAIEAMALLNVLCVDKTGTLTSDTVEFQEVRLFDQSFSRELFGQLVGVVARETSGGNITGEAIMRALKAPEEYTITEVMAFSSTRKMSGVRLEIGGELHSVVMGAPEFVSKMAKVSVDQQRQIDEWTSEGLRVLLVARLDDPSASLKKATVSGRALGVVLLKNSLRDGVEKTVQFLQNQGVSIRVISGDNPNTVRYIAEAAGVAHPEKVITGQALAGLSDKQFAKAADEHTIFARVLPEQKERLIGHFTEVGLFTGMVGDGVNDALALKKADLGVAMFAGAPASRRVADLILLDNSFTSLPLGMRLGNRIMQAIELIAMLFFHKIIFGLIVLFATMALNIVYPFMPRHNTFMNMFLVTMPTLMWTLFPPSPLHTINPRMFWRDTLWVVAPIAVISGATVAFTYWIASFVFPDSRLEVTTMTVLTATFFGVYLVFLAGKILGVRMNQSARIARLVYLTAVIFVAVTSFGIGPLRNFFDFTTPDILVLWPAIGVIVLAAVVQWQIAKNAGEKFQKKLI